jgi:drug/metabolite transporter (DMT)-like permease
LPGILIGCLAMIFLAVGIVMIKELLERTDVFWATLVRVAAASVSLLVLILFHPRRKQYFQELRFSKAWLTALPASIIGNYLALLCWVAGMKYTTASRAAILNQMSTIFIFILAAVFLKEKITLNKTIAILLALTGACLTIFG